MEEMRFQTSYEAGEVDEIPITRAFMYLAEEFKPYPDKNKVSIMNFKHDYTFIF